MNCPTCDTTITGIMFTDDLTPRAELAPNADLRGAKCQAADYLHFYALFEIRGGTLRVERLAILDGSPTHERLLEAKIEAGITKAYAVKTKRKRRKTPEWLTNLDQS